MNNLIKISTIAVLLTSCENGMNPPESFSFVFNGDVYSNDDPRAEIRSFDGSLHIFASGSMNESGEVKSISMSIWNITADNSYQDDQLGFGSGSLSFLGNEEGCLQLGLSALCCAEGNRMDFTNFDGLDSKVISGTFSGFLCRCVQSPPTQCDPGPTPVTGGVFENVRVTHN